MYRLVASILILFMLCSSVDAGAFKGKKVYYTHLKDACGFTGEVMGKKFTLKEWESFYNNKTLSSVLKKECPESKIITNKNDLKALFSFFRMFSKDSGNKASCDD